MIGITLLGVAIGMSLLAFLKCLILIGWPTTGYIFLGLVLFLAAFYGITCLFVFVMDLLFDE